MLEAARIMEGVLRAPKLRRRRGIPCCAASAAPPACALLRLSDGTVGLIRPSGIQSVPDCPTVNDVSPHVCLASEARPKRLR